jgi:DNA-3-methyladenine glycosylase II
MVAASPHCCVAAEPARYFVPSRREGTAPNMTAISHLIAVDRHLAAVHDSLGPPPLWKRPATFATLVRIILEQQVSLASAKSTFDKLKSTCGGQIVAPEIARLGDDALRGIGFSRQKARYTIALSKDVVDKTFRIGALRHKNDDDVRAAITSRLGLGDWSADVFLMMALLREDIFPTGDLALVKGLQELDGGVYDSKEKLLARAEPWRPYRSTATRMVWQSYLHKRNQTVP